MESLQLNTLPLIPECEFFVPDQKMLFSLLKTSLHHYAPRYSGLEEIIKPTPVVTLHMQPLALQRNINICVDTSLKKPMTHYEKRDYMHFTMTRISVSAEVDKQLYHAVNFTEACNRYAYYKMLLH